MTSDNADTPKSFEELFGSPEQVEAGDLRVEKIKSTRELEIGALENQYKSRGLHIDRGHYGVHPVQVSGEIDGLRFFFRFRSDYASLIVGPVNIDLEKAWVHDIRALRMSRIEKVKDDYVSGKFTEDQYSAALAIWTDALSRVKEYEPDLDDLSGFSPKEVHFSCSYSGIFGDKYKGDLDSPNEFYDTFCSLVEGLTPVPGGRRISELDQKLLTQYYKSLK